MVNYTMITYTYNDFITLVFAGITALFFGLTLGGVIYRKPDNLTYNFVTFVLMLVITIIESCLCMHAHGLI